MPTFFFDMASPDFVRHDHLGRDLSSLDDARLVGAAELSNWIGDRQFEGGHWLEIRDADGKLLARLDPAPISAPSPTVEAAPSREEAIAAAPVPADELLLAIFALRRTLGLLAAHGQEDPADSRILELLTQSYAERTAAQITHAASPHGS